jgi:hypothetical protein
MNEFTGRLTQKNVKILRSCAKGYVPVSELDQFIERIAEIMVPAKHSAWLGAITKTQADAKADKRKLTALIKAVEALQGTEALREMSAEFESRFFRGPAWHTRNADGVLTERPTGKNVLRIVKEIAADQVSKSKKKGRRTEDERREIFSRLYAAWTEVVGEPPPISEGIAFDKLAGCAWEHATGEKNISFIKWIEEFRKKDGVTK